MTMKTEKTGIISKTNNELVYDLAVIGGGTAGLAAAVQFRESCGGSVIVLERNETLGGILPQCVHDGFGIYEFGRQMTGPEYAQAWIDRAEAAGVNHIVSCDALELRRVCAGGADENVDVSADVSAPGARDAGIKRIGSKYLENAFEIKIISPETGPARVTAGAVVIATGCRERTRGGLRIPGSRPAGVYTAGQLQYMMNVKNLLPGRSAVILGSGDIGLIMARRMKWEGVNVKMILGQQASGLIRNYMQCVRDWDIPLRFDYTVASVHGRKRVTGVTVAPTGADGEPDMSRSEYIRCDTLVVAAGLVPETEIWKTLFTADGRDPEAIESPDETATQEAGVFVCGNTVRQYDTVDEVSVSGRRAGHRAALYLAGAAGGSDCAGAGYGDADADTSDHRTYDERTYIIEEKEFAFPAAGLPKHVMTEEDMEFLSGGYGAQATDSCGNEPRLGAAERPAVGDCCAAQNSAARASGGHDIIMYCISCPRGCRMTVSSLDDAACAGAADGVEGANDAADSAGAGSRPSCGMARAKVSGNGCPVGERYALQEISAPMREVTTTVAVKGDRGRLVPVRTSEPVPKDRVFDVIKRCRRIKAELPVKAGDALSDDALGGGSGIKVIACIDME